MTQFNLDGSPAQPAPGAPSDQFLSWYGQLNPQQRADFTNNVYIPQYIRQNYGYLAGYLDHPELGPILKKAASEGWTVERLQGEIFKTAWWQQTSQTAREFDLLTRTDPAEAQRQTQALASHLRTEVDKEGFGGQLSDARLAELSKQFLSQGIQGDDQLKFLYQDVHFIPDQATSGDAGARMQSIKATSMNDYFLPISDETAFELSRQVAVGSLDQDAINARFRDQAIQKYSQFTDDLNRGMTMKQVFDPYIQQTASLLERSPADINMMDPKFQPMIEKIDPESGQKRAMTIAESAQYVRGLSDWQNTQQAHQQAASMAETINKTFGKVST